MVHGMSHKWSLFHFMAQKVTLMAQLKIYILNGYREGPSCSTEVWKVPFMQKLPPRFVAIKFLKENGICNVSVGYVFDRLLKTNDVNSK